MKFWNAQGECEFKELKKLPLQGSLPTISQRGKRRQEQ